MRKREGKRNGTGEKRDRQDRDRKRMLIQQLRGGVLENNIIYK